MFKRGCAPNSPRISFAEKERRKERHIPEDSKKLGSTILTLWITNLYLFSTTHCAPHSSMYACMPEGIPPGDPMGMVSPPITKSFMATTKFSLSMLSPDGRWFTETARNTDGKQHAKVYQNLDDPNMFLIGFENLEGGGDIDFNDMVVSLKCVPAVGGFWAPVDKLELISPWISMISLILSTVAVSAVYTKRRKRH